MEVGQYLNKPISDTHTSKAEIHLKVCHYIIISNPEVESKILNN